jgi:hypothetical protein
MGSRSAEERSLPMTSLGTADPDQGAVAEPLELTALQERFVEEMMLDPTSATRAYIKAGGRGAAGSSARQQAARMMADGGVRAALAAARADRAARLRIDSDWVVEKLVSVINRCMEVEEIYDSTGERTGVFRFNAAGANAALRTMVLHLASHPPKDEPADVEAARERLRACGLNLGPPTAEECAVMERHGINLGDARALVKAERVREKLKARGPATDAS